MRCFLYPRGTGGGLLALALALALAWNAASLSAVPAPATGFASAPARITGDFSSRKKVRLFATFPAENLVRILDADGQELGQFDQVEEPIGVAVGGRKVYLASAATGSVEVYNYRRATIGDHLGSLGAGAGEFGRPVALAISPTNGRIYVSDVKRAEVRAFDPVTLQAVATLGDGQLPAPAGLAFATDGTLYVGDLSIGRVQQFGPDGTWVRSFTSQGNYPGETVRPMGVAVGPSGRIFVADAFFGHVKVYLADGTHVADRGSIGSGLGLMKTPLDLLVRPDGRILVTDSGDREIETFLPVP